MEGYREDLENEHANSQDDSCSDRDSNEAIEQLQSKSRSLKINNVAAYNPGSLIDSGVKSKHKIAKVK